MSAASSPRSDWLTGSSSRQRRPSKAAPVVASSAEVHVDAQPSYGASPEGRAHSRQTLSKHLSQSKLGVESAAGRLAPGDVGRPRSGSSVSVNSAVSATSSATGAARTTSFGSQSPLTTPVGSPAPARRRSSAGPGALPRSPSWYQSTSRKSSLALPTLSTIEGSIADLKVEELSAYGIRDTPSKPSPNSITMKRDRTSQDTANPKQPKRQATGDSAEIDETSKQGDGPFNTSMKDGTDFQQHEIATAPTDGDIAASQGDLQRSGATIEPTLRTWRSYLTLPRASKTRATFRQDQNPGPLDSGALISHAPLRDSLSDKETTSASTSPVQHLQKGAVDTAGASTRETAALLVATSGPEDKSSPTLEVPSLAAGADVNSLHSSSKSLNMVNTDSDQPKEPLIASSKAENPVALPTNAEHAIADPKTLRTIPPSTGRPVSWFSWATQSPNAAVVQDEHHLALPASAQDGPAKAVASQPETEAHTIPDSVPANLSENNLRENGRPHRKEEPNENYSTWSAWLGSYLGKPAETTSVTYAAGLAPSVTSSVASSNVPDADETSPPPPPSTSLEAGLTVPSPTLQRMNPILDVMPRSTWSSFFTTRTLPTRKAIDVKAANDSGEVETMEIDFGSLAASEVIGCSVGMVSNRTKSSLSSLRTSTVASSAHPSPSTSAAAAAAGSAGSSASSSTMKLSVRDKKGLNDSAAMPTTLKAKKAGPQKPPRPNLVLPTFEDTFNHPPRSLPLNRTPITSPTGLKKAVTASISYFFSSSLPRPRSNSTSNAGTILTGKEREVIGDMHERLPKAKSVVEVDSALRQAGRVAVIGVHGWFIQTYLKNVVGEPTGTSTKFANMMKSSVKQYYAEMGHPLNDEAITAIPLEGDGTVKDRTERLYENLMVRQDWVEALNSADRIFIASHSQGTIVSAMLVERLINEGEINGTKCMMLNMCSVSQGPFYSLYNSWTVPAYLYFETAAATELFEFQKPTSAVSRAYNESLRHILNAGVKILFVASLNDQVVPLYSALFSSLSHPNILRTIFIDSSVFETSADFMTSLVVFSTRLRNAGLNCHGLDLHLSEALMGSLVGVGHSTVYEESTVYKYAVRYLMETTSPLLDGHGGATGSEDLYQVEDFNPRAPANPYFLPWALRGIIEDPQIRTLFSDDLQSLRDQFEEWRPKTKALQQVQAALEPLRLIPRSAKSNNEFEEAVSKTDKKATAKL